MFGCHFNKQTEGYFRYFEVTSVRSCSYNINNMHKCYQKVVMILL